jgi:hypothetical protein
MEHNLVNGIKIPLTPQEIEQRQADELAWNDGAFDRAISSLRAKRNALLKDSDYTVLQDNSLSSIKRTEWMNYRTALRNLPQGLKTVEEIQNVIFPIKP